MKTKLAKHLKWNTRKNAFLLFLSMVGALLLFGGCKGKGNTLFEKALPEYSALFMYKYDGETCTQYDLYDPSIEQQILDTLSSVSVKEVKNWSPDQLTYPIYGLHMSQSDGSNLIVAWSNNYMIVDDGSVYSFDYDIEGILSGHPWNDQKVMKNTTFFPCSRVLSLKEETWIPTLLKEVTDMNPPEGISIGLVEKDGNLFTVSLTNNTEEEWCYGTYFSVQAYLDGYWYDIPTVPGNWAFHDIAMVLAPGTSVKETYDIGMYGDLPAGLYRLEVEDMVVAFVVE